MLLLVILFAIKLLAQVIASKDIIFHTNKIYTYNAYLETCQLGGLTAVSRQLFLQKAPS